VSQMIFHFSSWSRFMPGDFISTASPAWVGYGRNPPIFLNGGDAVEVSIEQIGVLRNPAVAADSVSQGP